MKPFSIKMNLENGNLEEYRKKIVRRLSDMKGFYIDQEKEKRELSKDPVIYEVYEVSTPSEAGQLSYGVTILYPGKIGEEYYMTKGHFHEKESTGEIYIGISGSGILLMETKDGDHHFIEMRRGTIAYVPPNWAHRSINTGKEMLTFLAIYPSDAGHDYGTIEKKGFRKVVIEVDGKAKIMDNPRYQ
ncbi:MAG: glucose-6-phosphate isomerase [Candidatus Hydrothermarchaeota archaeon]